MEDLEEIERRRKHCWTRTEIAVMEDLNEAEREVNAVFLGENSPK